MTCSGGNQRLFEIEVALKHAQHFIIDDVFVVQLHKLGTLGVDRFEPDLTLRFVLRIEMIAPFGVG